MRPLRRALAPFLVLLVLGCGGSDEEKPVEISADPRRNVLVIDDGFDPSAPAFKGRLVTSYSIACSQGGAQTIVEDGGAPDAGEADGGAGDGGVADLTARKAALITGLKVRDTRCRLNPGIAPKPDPFPSIARLRDRWNGAIRGSKFADGVFNPAELQQIRDAQQALGKSRFHGTATAGIIAHANPHVRLVLVEELLGTSESIMAEFQCFTQQEIDENVSLFGDLEVRQAYVERPASALDDDFRDLFLRHRIGLWNESFGTLSRQALEELQAKKGCVAVDLRRYFTVLGELDSARAKIHPDGDALLVKSAGNDGSRIDGTADHPMCFVAGNPRLIVGAYDDSGKATDFTNFGQCVDVVAPGYRIITPVPGGWLLPLSGTSFSAPLTVRLVTMSAQPTAYTPAAARDMVLSLRDGQQRIPLDRFPREFLYDPEMVASKWALTLAGDRATPQPRVINLRKLRAFEELLRRGR